MTGECYHTYLEMQVFKKKVLEGQGGSGNTDVAEFEVRDGTRGSPCGRKELCGPRGETLKFHLKRSGPDEQH